MQNLKIGIVQANLKWEDCDGNLAHLESLMNTFFENNIAELVLLPEMFSTGFTMNKELAESMDGQAIAWMKEQSKKFKTAIGGSLIIKEGAQYFNRFLIVDGDDIITAYNKRHLFRMAGEHEVFTGGDDRVIVEFNGWKILLQVCYDLRFPVFSRNRKINDQPEYDLAIYVANWPAKRAMAWKALLQARAIENQCFAIGVNRVGEDGNQINYSGDSRLIDPWGNITNFAEAGEELVKCVELDANELIKIRSTFPAFLDADDFKLQQNQ